MGDAVRKAEEMASEADTVLQGQEKVRLQA